MSISERLQMVIKMNGMTNSTFADKIGVQRSSVSHVLAERNKPSIDFIQKILDTFPKVDANWLVTGKKVGRTLESNETPPEVKETVAHSNTPLQSTNLSGQHPFKSSQQHRSIESRTIQKVVVFYNDGTYEELLNNSGS